MGSSDTDRVIWVTNCGREGGRRGGGMKYLTTRYCIDFVVGAEDPHVIFDEEEEKGASGETEDKEV